MRSRNHRNSGEVCEIFDRGAPVERSRVNERARLRVALPYEQLRARIATLRVREKSIMPARKKSSRRKYGKAAGKTVAERHAPKETRQSPLGQRRQGRQSEESQASHCDWPLGSPQKGSQGPEEKSRLRTKFGSGVAWRSGRRYREVVMSR